jgi:ribonuclease G
MSFELLLGRYAGQSWAAVFESGRVVEVYIELLRGETEVGKIIKARVSRVLPGIQAAFIDLGGEQDGFLPVRDLMAAGESVAHWEQGGANSHPRDVAPIEDRIRVGSELLVQVARDALGTKGARLTCNLSIAGRLLVLFPRLHARKVSRKIDDPEERERLLGMAQRLPDEQLGFVVRTAARGASERAIRADAEDLRDTWHEIDARIKQAASPSVVYEAHNLVFRMLRDAPREVLGRIIVEDVEDRDSVLRMLDRIDPDLSSHVEMHTGRESLFETYNIETEIGKALRAKVWLKSGGYLIIEPTEALVSIDVNTGKFVGRKHLEETVLKTNLEAAREVTRQLRLRSLGGVIVIDFIDMESEASRREVIEALEEGLRSDRARTKVFGFSELGVLQLTRKRSMPGLAEQLTRRCILCSGTGRIKAAISVASAALAEVQRIAAHTDEPTLTVRARSEVVEVLNELISTLGPSLISGARLELEIDGQMHPETFEVHRRPGSDSAETA